MHKNSVDPDQTILSWNTQILIITISSPIHSSVIVKYMPSWLARSYPRSTAVQEVAGSILRSGISSCGNISSYLWLK